jgi:hypothetical protein
MKNIILTASLVVFASVMAFAQPNLPVTPPNEEGPSAIPIDGGASILLGAGAVMGYKRLTKKK